MLEQRAKWASHARQGEQGAITGSVVGFDGQPIASACVTAVGAGRSVTTMAAPDGTFRLAGLTAGSYALAADSPYKNAATDGTDIGANRGMVATVIAPNPPTNLAVR